MSKKYKFHWDLLGNSRLGRPNLGSYTRVEIYRLMQFTFRDILETELGSDKTDAIFYKAGKLSGEEFYKNYLAGSSNLSDLVKQLQTKMIEMGIGILRIEEACMDKGELVLTIGEDLNCSGLPELDCEVCHYEEGFIAGILSMFTGNAFDVKEIDCWCMGDRICRFEAKIANIS